MGVKLIQLSLAIPRRILYEISPNGYIAAFTAIISAPFEASCFSARFFPAYSAPIS